MHSVSANPCSDISFSLDFSMEQTANDCNTTHLLLLLYHNEYEFVQDFVCIQRIFVLRLHAPKEEVLMVLAMLPEKGSIRGLARATNRSQNTISGWIKVAGDHCSEVNEYYSNNLKLERVQVDEIWSYIKKTKKPERQRFS
jgi:hypothetical protein